MKLFTLRDLYIDQLKDLFDAERQLVTALPRLEEAASSYDLKSTFGTHLEETEEHIERLRRIISRLDERPAGNTCRAMQGLIQEGEDFLGSEDTSPAVLDAGIIAAAQRVEHFEIASYGAVRAYARILEEDEAAELLDETLAEEGRVDKALTLVAEKINAEAADPANE